MHYVDLKGFCKQFDMIEYSAVKITTFSAPEINKSNETLTVDERNPFQKDI